MHIQKKRGSFFFKKATTTKGINSRDKAKPFKANGAMYNKERTKQIRKLPEQTKETKPSEEKRIEKKRREEKRRENITHCDT